MPLGLFLSLAFLLVIYFSFLFAWIFIRLFSLHTSAVVPFEF